MIGFSTANRLHNESDGTCWRCASGSKPVEVETRDGKFLVHKDDPNRWEYYTKATAQGERKE